jgi:nitroreductase
MPAVSGSTVVEQLKWRYATKVFDPAKKISDEDWQHLEESLILAPSSFGLQPWKFVIITDQAIKDQLPAMSFKQRQVADASHVVVFAVKKSTAEADVDAFVERTAIVRAITADSLAGMRRMLVGFLSNPSLDKFHWASLQAYIALGQFMAAAAMMGIDTCPMEGIEPQKYDQLLGLPQLGYATVVACVAGYRADSCKYATVPKVRFDAKDVIDRR